MKLQQLHLLKHWHCMVSHKTMTVSIKLLKVLLLLRLRHSLPNLENFLEKYKENEAREPGTIRFYLKGVSDLLEDILNQVAVIFFGLSSK